MVDWIGITLACAAVTLLCAGFLARLRPYRSLAWGACALLSITALLPRPGNGLGVYLFGGTASQSRLPTEVFGIAWWALGAWLLNSLLDLVLRRTLFPQDDEPHARRLFADLASGVIYVVAFVGVMDTVFQIQMSAVLATSGVLAIVLGLAFQSTLGDVLSGLAINIDRPFGAGDWIAVAPDIEGEVVQINWRATRLRTWLGVLVVIPNSVIARSVVANHTRLARLHRCAIQLQIDHAHAPARVLALLEAAANATSEAVSPPDARASALGFRESQVTYQVAFNVTSFAVVPATRSALVGRIAAALQADGVPIGTLVSDLRLVTPADLPWAADAATGARPATGADAVA